MARNFDIDESYSSEGDYRLSYKKHSDGKWMWIDFDEIVGTEGHNFQLFLRGEPVATLTRTGKLMIETEAVKVKIDIPKSAQDKIKNHETTA